MNSLIEGALLAQVRESVMPLVARVDRAATDWLSRQLAELGVSMPDFRIIGALLGESEGIPQHVLAKRLRIEAATLSVALAKLEAKGVVTRYADPEDTRVRRVSISKRGSRFGEIKVLLEILDRSVLHGLSDEEIQGFRQVMLRMEANLVALNEKSALAEPAGTSVQDRERHVT